MSRLKSIVGWTLRGGDQTRTEFASQAEAIRELQQRLSEIHELVNSQAGHGERLEAEVRSVLGDLTTRLGSITDRLDALDARTADHDALLSSLARTVAPPKPD